MEIRKIIGAQAVRLIPVTETDQKPTSFARFLKGLEQKYCFLQVPNTLAEFNPQSGIAFHKGLFEDQLIERFVVYNKGLLCGTGADSDLCDGFLDDVQTWGESEFGFSPNSKKGKSDSYESHLEVHIDDNLAMAFQAYSGIGQSIWECLKSYGHSPAMFEVSGITLHTDVIQLPDAALHPIQFRLERRANNAYFANIYYAQAPLRTQDHVAVLQELEKALRA